MPGKILGFCGPLIGGDKDFVDKQIHDIKARLQEVYGETLPKELEKELPYIVTETYKVTYMRFHNLYLD